MRLRTCLVGITGPSLFRWLVLLTILGTLPGSAALGARVIDDLPTALADASSKMPESCRRDVAHEFAGLFEALRSFDDLEPYSGVSKDSLHAAIAPLSRHYPDGEKILYYGVLVAIDQYDRVFRSSEVALADSLALARTRIRLATIEPTDNRHVNKYFAMLAARLDQLHDLLHTMLVCVDGEVPCAGTPLPLPGDVTTIDEACTYIHGYMTVLHQAADGLVASCTR